MSLKLMTLVHACTSTLDFVTTPKPILYKLTRKSRTKLVTRFSLQVSSDKSKFYDIVQGSSVNFSTGGSISHHHGVGKLRARWYKQSVSNIGVNLYKSAKVELDPKNIFATGNFLMPEDEINYQQIRPKL